MPVSPYPQVVLRALAQLPPNLREVVADGMAVADPFLRLEAAEADAATHVAGLAGEGAASANEHSGGVIGAVRDARAKDAARLDEICSLVSTVTADLVDLDRLSELLDVDDVAATRESFDAFMRDDALTLDLTPPTTPSADADDRPGRIAEHRPDGPVELSRSDVARLCRPGEVPHTGAGRFVLTASGPAMLLGNGTGLSLMDGALVSVSAPADASGRRLRATRWVSGRAPQLRDHASAALAVCRAAREDQLDIDPARLPAALAVGVAVEPTGPFAEELTENVAFLRALAKVKNANQAAATLVRVAFELYRLRVSLDSAVEVEGLPVIQVGQVRWCTTSDRPIVWMPMSEASPDTVGGADRAWTDGALTGSTLWAANSPALSLDRNWAAALVVVPGDPALWCVGPDGRWWELGVAYDELVAVRRRHLEPWLEALAALHEDAPAIIRDQSTLGSAEPADAAAGLATPRPPSRLGSPRAGSAGDPPRRA